jgi:hypothetical protein
MQFWPVNQELFIRLEHYRPYCYINYLIEPCAIRCDSFHQLLISLQQLLIYLRNASAGAVLFGVAGVFCGPAAAQTARVAIAQNNDAPPDVGAHDRTFLSWRFQDVKDAMTDRVTRTAVGQADLDNGTTVQAIAKCDEVGVEFEFNTYSNKEPISLPMEGKQIRLRVRTDDGDTRVAVADHPHTNQAKTLFYEPVAAKTVIGRSGGGSGGDSPMEKALAGWMKDGIIKQALDKLSQDALGTTDVLARAKSVRIELILRDGRTDVFDLNPQDQVLKSTVEQCIAGLGTHSTALPQHEAMAPSLPFAQPKRLTLQRPITVYLAPNGKSPVTMQGEIFILGQKEFSNGFVCVVRGKAADGREVAGVIAIPLLGAALDENQSKSCYMPHGMGGVELTTAN